MAIVIATQIEISAPPAAVRAKFLDFETLPTYHPNGFFKRLGPPEPNTPIEVGTKFHNILEIATDTPTVLENSPAALRWKGTLPLGLFTGIHSFEFKPSMSKENVGGTLFVHKEEFTGMLGGMVGDGYLGSWMGVREKTFKGFGRFNEDLKRWCEGSEARK